MKNYIYGITQKKLTVSFLEGRQARGMFYKCIYCDTILLTLFYQLKLEAEKNLSRVMEEKNIGKIEE